MTYKFTIPTAHKRTPSLNEYITAERIRVWNSGSKMLTKGAILKKAWQEDICAYILNDLGRVKVKPPVIIHYNYYEIDSRRDVGNIHAPVQKFVEDALQDCGVIQNDNQKCVIGFTAHFGIDRLNPRVEVEIEEVTHEKGEKGV